jgi:hypothetical protein
MSCAYSDSYRDARSRFRAAARNIGAELEAQLVQGAPDSDQNLTIDIARVGAPNPAWSVIVSSGLHGVEGFLGSAIQISSLKQLSVSDLVESGGEFILIHAINPFGFHELRRVNEYNVDLNRNFLLPGEGYQGTSAEYENLNDLLNPSSPPRLLDPYLVKLGWRIVRIGFPALKQAVAEGQFSYPNGLFFGGHKPARSTQIIQDNIMRWPRGEHIVHLDFHSGLGRYAKFRLFAPANIGPEELSRYRQLFGADIELVGIGGGLGYDVRGDLGRWATATAAPRYRFLFVEFGTYSPIRILDALHRENQVHFFASADDGARRRAKLALLECFCPSSPSWRAAVLRAGIEVIELARQGVARA